VTRTFIMLLATLGASGCTLVVNKKLDEKPTQASLDSERTDAGRELDASDAPIDAGPDADTAPSGDGGPDDMVDGGADDGGPKGLDRSAIRLSLGQDHACGLLPSGKLTCWGSNLEAQRVLPSGMYRDVACGDYHTCAITEAGKLVCVGRNRDGQRVNEAGPYTAVAAGDTHTCALDAKGKVTCWGSDAQGVLDTPPDLLSAITAGEGYACGIRSEDSTAVCWGYSATERTSPPAGTQFLAIDAGREHACGVTLEGRAVCWGDKGFRAPTLLNIVAVSGGDDASCALAKDGDVRCWNDYGEYTFEKGVEGPYAQVASGNTGVCLVPRKGSLICLTGTTTAIVPAPTGFPE